MDVRVFGLEDEFTRNDMGSWAPLTVTAYPAAWPESFGYSAQFYQQLVSFSPDVIHTHGLWQHLGVAANRYCRKFGKLRSFHLMEC